MTHTTCQHGDTWQAGFVSFLFMSSAFILRPPRSSLDVHQQPWQTHTLLSHHRSSLSACPARQKKTIYCMSAAKALSSPSFSKVCTPPSTVIHKHAYTHSYKLADRNTSGEPVKIWVTQQEQGVWIYSGWCSVLTFSDNGWEIMEKADIQTGNIAAAAWCLSWSRMKRIGVMMLHCEVKVWLGFIAQQRLHYH